MGVVVTGASQLHSGPRAYTVFPEGCTQHPPHPQLSTQTLPGSAPFHNSILKTKEMLQCHLKPNLLWSMGEALMLSL